MTSFTWLPDAAWRGALLLAIAFVLARLLRSQPAAVRHVLWTGALAGVIAMPILAIVAPVSLPVTVPSRIVDLATPVTPSRVGEASGSATERLRRESAEEQLGSTGVFHECLTRRKLVTRHRHIDLQTLRLGHECALGPGVNIWRALHQRIRRSVLDDGLHARSDPRHAKNRIWHTDGHIMEPDELLRSAARIAPRPTGARRGRVEIDFEIRIDA